MSPPVLLPAPPDFFSRNRPRTLPLTAPRIPALVLSGLFVAAAPALAQPGEASPVPAAPSPAAPAVTAIEMAGQPLGQALADLARQTGTSLIVAPALIEGRMAPPVSGSFPVREAYQRLLAGSGLEARFDGAMVIIQQRQPGAGAGRGAAPTTLPTVNVVGTGHSPTISEGTRSYTTQATSASTGLELAPREIPQSVTVVTRQQIQDQGLSQLTEVVGQVAGLHLGQGGNVGSDSSAIYSRGFQVDNYLVDGVKMLSSYSSIFQSQDTLLYDRIEVVRGASGLMIGAGAPGAAINLIRRRPTRDFQGSATVSLGSWKYRRLDVDVSSPLNEAGTIRGRLLGAVQDAGSYVDRLDEDRRILAGVIEADLAPGTLVRIGATHQRHDSTGHSRGGRPAYFSDGSRTDWGRSESAGASWAYSRRHSTGYYAQLEHQINTDWKLQASLSQIRTDSDELVGYLGGVPDRETGAGARIWATHWTYRPVQNIADLSTNGRFDLFGRRHELAAGVTLARSKQSRDPAYTNWNHAGWNPAVDNIYTWDGSQPAAPPNPAVGYGGDTEHNYSGFASLRLRPTDALSVIIGSRVTNWERRGLSHRFATGLDEHSLQKESRKVVPYLGVVQDFSEHWSVYGSFTTIFQPQNVKTVTGAQIDPVYGDSYEVGLKGAFYDNRLNVGLALYQIKEDNKALPIPDVFAPDGSQAYEALSGTTSRGVELEVAGQLRPGWQLVGSWSHNVTRDRDGERLLTAVPKNLLKLFTSYQLASVGNGLTVGSGLTWQSKAYSDDMGPLGVRFTQPSYALVQLMARYPINRSMSASVHLWNALDKVYYGSTGNSYHGTPRAARVALTVTF